MYASLIKYIKNKIVPNLATIVLISFLVFLCTILVVKGFDKIKGVFGFDTVDSVNAKLHATKQDLSTLDTVNKNLSKTIDLQADTSAKKIETIIRVRDDMDTINSDLLTVLKEKDKLIAELKAKQEVLKKVTVLEPMVIKSARVKVTKPRIKKLSAGHSPPSNTEKQISHVQISAIWTRYCQVSNSCNSSSGTLS